MGETLEQYRARHHAAQTSVEDFERYAYEAMADGDKLRRERDVAIDTATTLHAALESQEAECERLRGLLRNIRETWDEFGECEPRTQLHAIMEILAADPTKGEGDANNQ
jgi:hypothetical protein